MRKDVVVGAMALLALLGGCTDADWTRAISFVGVEPSAPAQLQQKEPAEQPQPVPVAAQENKTDNWCRTVAQQDAARNAFDAKTRQGILQQSYDQCVALFGASDSR
jgi:hypothetical protein